MTDDINERFGVNPSGGKWQVIDTVTEKVISTHLTYKTAADHMRRLYEQERKHQESRE